MVIVLKSLRSKLHKSLTGFLLVLAITLAGLFFYDYSKSLEEDQEKLVQGALSMVNQRIDDFHEIHTASLKLFINDVRKSYTKGTIDEDHVKLAIDEYDELFNFGSSMAIGLEDGRMFSSHLESLPEGYDPRLRPWYINALKSDQVYLTQPYLSADIDHDDLYIFSYSKSVKVNDQLIGVAGVDVDLDKIFRFNEDLHLPEGAFACITSSQGQVMISNYHDQRTLLGLNLAVDDKIIIQKISFNIYSKTNNQTGWQSLILVPSQLHKQLIIDTAFMSFIVLMVIIILMWFFTKGFAKRISHPLEEVVNQLEATDLKGQYQPIMVTSNDIREVHVLTEGINSLLIRGYNQHEAIRSQQGQVQKQFLEIQNLYEASAAINDQLESTMNQLEDSWLETIRVLSNAIEANDLYTKGHCDRVARLAYLTGLHYGLKPDQLKDLQKAAILHDIGKVGIPDSILNKEGPLTESEYDMIKTHPQVGYNIIKDVPHLKRPANFILHHHERVDGQGYPFGLTGDMLSVEAKILSIVDAYDAMTTIRSYRKEPLSHDKALHELLTHAGRQFDEKVLAAFMDAIKADSL